MNKSYLINANAKINLSLNCFKRNADGYHDLDMVMVPISLCDTITIEEISEDTYLTCSDKDVPTDNSNLVLKAYELLKTKYQIKNNYHFHIDKKIPSQAGLGGGSADCGAVIKKLVEINHLKLTSEELTDLGKSLGSDVPFFIFNKPSRCLGRGEKLIPFELTNHYRIALFMPRAGVSTPASYHEFDNILPAEKADNEALIKGLQNQNYDLIKDNMINNLQPGSIKLAPEIEEVINKVKLMLPLTMMSGSGSCVFSVLRDEKDYLNYLKIKEDRNLIELLNLTKLVEF